MRLAANGSALKIRITSTVPAKHKLHTLAVSLRPLEPAAGVFLSLIMLLPIASPVAAEPESIE